MSIWKKISKAFAVVLSAACILTMTSATAFAEEENQTQTVTVQQSESDATISGLTFTKIFKSEDGGLVPNMTFSFSMEPVTVEANATKDGISLKTGIDLGSDGKVDIVYTSLSDAEQKGTFSFENTQFTGPAVYRYKVYENIPVVNVNKYVTYDYNTYLVDVLVNKDGKVLSVINATDGSDQLVNKKPIEFTNTYNADNLVIEKQVGGSMGDKTEMFDFELEIPGPGTSINLSEGAEFEAYIEDFNEGTKKKVNNVVVGTTYKFQLSDGQALLVENVPANMIYMITEQGATDYTTNITCTTGNGNDKRIVSVKNSKYYDARPRNDITILNGQDTAIVKGGNLVVFENVKDYKTDTGVRLDVIPYIVVFVIAVIAVTGLVFFKRRK